MTDSSILVATIGRPHGVRGLVRLHAATADPVSVELLGDLKDEKGRHWQVSWRGAGIAELRDAQGRAVADRNAAEALVNLRLYASRGALPETGEDEFYHADLIDMEAVSPEGEVLGKVSVVHDYGAGVSLEITGKRIVLVPFTRACVPEIEIEAGRLIVVEPDEIEVEGDLEPEGSRA